MMMQEGCKNEYLKVVKLNELESIRLRSMVS